MSKFSLIMAHIACTMFFAQNGYEIYIITRKSRGSVLELEFAGNRILKSKSKFGHEKIIFVKIIFGIFICSPLNNICPISARMVYKLSAMLR